MAGDPAISLEPCGLQPTRLLRPWGFQGKSTGVGCHCLLRMDYAVHGILQARILECLSLLQGIFPTQGSNPGLPHCRQILYQLSHRGSPRILEWVAYPFSSGSFQPKGRTGVSCIAGGFFTIRAITEAQVGGRGKAKGQRRNFMFKFFLPKHEFHFIFLILVIHWKSFKILAPGYIVDD